MQILKFTLLICFLSGCNLLSQKPTPVIQEHIDATGIAVKISIPSKKIISTSPGIVESLYALGKGDDIIAVTDNCSSLPQEKEKIGDKENISIKKLIRLSPELILSMDGDMPEQTITNLRDMGLTVFVLKKCAQQRDIQENFRILGTITATQNVAELNIAEADKRINEVTKGIKPLSPRVFIQIGANPLTTAGMGSIADTIIRLAGGENIVRGKTKFPLYTTPAVMKNNPDVIILSGVHEEEVSRWKQIEALSASQTNRIYLVDPNLMNASTPLALAEAVERVHKLLYPMQ